MGQILLVAEALGRGVGHHHVHAAAFPQGEAETGDPFDHLPLRELLGGVGPILKAAAQAQNAQASVDDQLIVDAVAALRRAAGISLVVVPVDVEEGGMGHGDQKGKVVRLQIPGGQDEIVPVQPPGPVVVPQGRALLVGNG